MSKVQDSLTWTLKLGKIHNFLMWNLSLSDHGCLALTLNAV